MIQQLSLFEDDIPRRTKPKTRQGGSNNPIVFHDYDSYVAKFAETAKTTDDTYTPRDVYDAVLRYVGEVYDLRGREILRPFFPGGDFENAEYPEDGVVIDNPPFSIFMRCVRFFTAHGIPFFLFGPGMTIMSCVKYCTAVIIDEQITFDNGAVIRCNFASNLYGDVMAVTAPRLSKLISACPSQNVKVKLPTYVYPDELLSTSDMQTICRGGIEFAVRRADGVVIRDLDNFPKNGGLYGDHLLITTAKAAAKAAIPVLLSERERNLIKSLDR